MKIRHLQKVDAATTAVDNNNKRLEEKATTDALFSLLKKTEATQDYSEEEADSQASVVLGKWTKTALDEEATDTTAQLKAPKRSIRKAATNEKESPESHYRQKHIVKLGSDGSVLDGSNQEITRLNFGVQHDNNVSVIIADFSALSWANQGRMNQYTPVISFCNKDTPGTVISYVMNTSEQWSAEFYIPKEITNITNGMFLFSLQEKEETEGNNIHTASEIWVSKTVSFYTAPNIFNNNMLTASEPNPNIDSLAYLSKNRIDIQDTKSANLGYDFSFGEFPIILGTKFDQYVKLMKLSESLMRNYECSKGFLLLKPTTATSTTDQPTVCRFQAIKDKTDPSKNNYYCMLPKEITENAQSYTIAVAIADEGSERIYWSSNQTATVINNFLSNIGQLTNNLQEGFSPNGGGLTTADNYILISYDDYIIDTNNQ